MVPQLGRQAPRQLSAFQKHHDSTWIPNIIRTQAMVKVNNLASICHFGHYERLDIGYSNVECNSTSTICPSPMVPSMKRWLFAWSKHPILVTGFLVALGVTLFFATRLIFFTIYWSDPAHRDQVLQGWMTPGYVAKSWDISREDMLAALGGVPVTGNRRTLEQIAEDRGIALRELITQIETAIAGHRANQ